MIYAVKKFGAKNVEAVFCDTGWEHPITVQFVEDVCNQLGVHLTVLRKMKGDQALTFEKLCEGMKCFPGPGRRACTAVLKIQPMIDWMIQQDDNLLVIQGIRGKESASRSKMARECMYFAEYFEETSGGRKYRKNAVKEWCKTHDASLWRPVFDWTAQQVIDYILAAGLQPNPLYKRGASRVGCFPCVLSRHSEIKVVSKDKEMMDRIINLEHKLNSIGKLRKPACFFTHGYIPERFCKTWGNGFPTAEEVFAYVTRDDIQLDLFEPEEGYSCMSLYHGLCE